MRLCEFNGANVLYGEAERFWICATESEFAQIIQFLLVGVLLAA